MQDTVDPRVTSAVTQAMHDNETTPALYLRRKLREGHEWKNATLRAQMSGDIFNEPIITELIKDGYEVPLIQQLVKKGNYKHERIQAIKAKIAAEQGAKGVAVNE